MFQIEKIKQGSLIEFKLNDNPDISGKVLKVLFIEELEESIYITLENNLFLTYYSDEFINISKRSDAFKENLCYENIISGNEVFLQVNDFFLCNPYFGINKKTSENILYISYQGGCENYSLTIIVDFQSKTIVEAIPFLEYNASIIENVVYKRN